MKTTTLTSQTREFISAISGKFSRKNKNQDQSAPEEVEEKPLPPRSFSWLKLFVFSTISLLLMGAGMMAVSTIEALFSRHPVFGFIGTGLFALAILALVVMSVREIFALMKLRRITKIREQGEQALKEEDDILRKEVITQTHSLYAKRNDLSKAFDKLSENKFDTLSPSERFTHFETEVMSPLDKRARHIISDTAKRVSMLTAVSPIATLDVAFVCWQNLRMLNKLANVYSGRPGTVETLKLAKMVLSHLALTGGIAMGDNLLQNILGRGLAAKVSTRLGEGLANGILTSRVGLAALDVCRPLPFETLKKPSLKNLIGPLISLKGEEDLAA